MNNITGSNEPNIIAMTVRTYSPIEVAKFCNTDELEIRKLIKQAVFEKYQIVKVYDGHGAYWDLTGTKGNILKTYQNHVQSEKEQKCESI